jgi:hypothetical protein
MENLYQPQGLGGGREGFNTHGTKVPFLRYPAKRKA